MSSIIPLRHLIRLVEDASTLDISPEARRQRAEQLGFDTSQVWYTGTPHGDIEEFDPDRTPDELLAFGKGIYTTQDATAASGYAKPGASWGNHTEDPQPTVYPVWLKVQKAFDLEAVYPFPEVKRILSEVEDSDLLAELTTDATFDPGWSEELDELSDRLFDLEHQIDHEDVNPDDYENGVADEDYDADLEAAIAYDRKAIQKRIDFIHREIEDDRKSHEQMVQSGRRGAARGKDIYKDLYTHTTGYYDWRAESQLFGGESDLIEFKTEANRILADLGYDAITHVDRYNPGQKGVAHKVMIVFKPSQVRSIYAAFDPARAESGRISETR